MRKRSRQDRPAEVVADATFAVVPTWVIDAPVSSNAVRLYAVLRRYADQSGVAWPSRATLAERMRCSRDTIDRALRELVELGAVTTVHRKDERTGALTSSLYRVHAQPAGKSVDNQRDLAASVRVGGRKDAAGVGAGMRQNPEPVNEITPQPPQSGGACPTHETPQPNRRCCGTTPRQLAAAERAARPSWCGRCDERTRLVELAAGPARCGSCHPLAASWT